MTSGAVLANTLWLAGSLPAARRFATSLANPRLTQERLLRQMLRRDASSAFGEANDFRSVQNVSDFQRKVSLSSYEDFEPSIERIRRGERNVLTSERVTHLAPTSGSSGAAKDIPFTPSLQRGFTRAVSAWMTDLTRQRPRLLGGRAYWSITPVEVPNPIAPDASRPGESRHPAIDTGFADDAEYLGGSSAWLVRRALAVPAEVRHVRETRAFWRLTLLALLRCRDLRLVSIWHPSYLELLVTEAESGWAELLESIEAGTCPWATHLPASSVHHWRTTPDRNRASELRQIGPRDWRRWWPHLQVVSCWGEQAAEPGWRQLVRQAPDVLVQPKGLLATEAVVTIPWRGTTPLAITSHLFEFINDEGEFFGADQLRRGKSYEVVVTNGGGLWRYRLGDMVECTGHVHSTPVLRFLGRAGRVTDLRGEKLSEAFVASVISGLWKGDEMPAYAALRAHESSATARYDLLISSDWRPNSEAELADRADRALSRNPHYAIARRLGQLAPLTIVWVDADESHRRLRESPLRLGDTKPAVLLRSVD